MKDIVILNVANVSSLSDYFIIATGNSTPQVRGLTETIRKKVKDIFKRLPIGLETEKPNSWNLLDYGEVVVHIMHTTQNFSDFMLLGTRKYIPIATGKNTKRNI